jgi:Fe2+ transport system protein B
MELKEIASISGKGGLFKIMKPGKAGVILESLDAAKLKLVAGGKERMSVLSEISIYTTTKEGTESLQEVIKKIKKQFGAEIGVTPESDNAKLKAFLKSVLPEYDEDRVYVSDIKKLVKWYSILLLEAPEVFEQEEKEEVKG